jgi:hypothetical protein
MWERDLYYLVSTVDRCRNKQHLHSLPIVGKFSSLRTGNVRPYLVGGLSATLNLSSSKSKDDNAEQKFR